MRPLPLYTCRHWAEWGATEHQTGRVPLAGSAQSPVSNTKQVWISIAWERENGKKKKRQSDREERRKGRGRKIESRTTFRFQRQPSRWSNLHTSKCPEPLTRYRWTCLSNRMITHRFQQIPGFEQSLTAAFLLSFAATPRPHAMQDVLNGEGSSAFGWRQRLSKPTPVTFCQAYGEATGLYSPIPVHPSHQSQCHLSGTEIWYWHSLHKAQFSVLAPGPTGRPHPPNSVFTGLIHRWTGSLGYSLGNWVPKQWSKEHKVTKRKRVS